MDFYDWLSGATIYIGYSRHGYLGGYGFVVASVYEESEELKKAIEGLSGGDLEAIRAKEYISALNYMWIDNNADPSEAMTEVVNQARALHRGLNGK